MYGEPPSLGDRIKSIHSEERVVVGPKFREGLEKANEDAQGFIDELSDERLRQIFTYEEAYAEWIMHPVKTFFRQLVSLEDSQFRKVTDFSLFSTNEIDYNFGKEGQDPAEVSFVLGLSALNRNNAGALASRVKGPQEIIGEFEGYVTTMLPEDVNLPSLTADYSAVFKLYDMWKESLPARVEEEFARQRSVDIRMFAHGVLHRLRDYKPGTIKARFASLKIEDTTLIDTLMPIFEDSLLFDKGIPFDRKEVRDEVEARVMEVARGLKDEQRLSLVRALMDEYATKYIGHGL